MCLETSYTHLNFHVYIVQKHIYLILLILTMTWHVIYGDISPGFSQAVIHCSCYVREQLRPAKVSITWNLVSDKNNIQSFAASSFAPSIWIFKSGQSEWIYNGLNNCFVRIWYSQTAQKWFQSAHQSKILHSVTEINHKIFRSFNSYCNEWKGPNISFILIYFLHMNTHLNYNQYQ